MLRRLGPGKGGLGANRVAVFTAGAVFLAAWLPFNNGLRPEPLIALGVIATWMLVERAIALQRLAPAAVAIVVAMLTATLAPQGLIAVAALLTGARAIAQIIRRRRATDGLLAPLAVLAASLSLILVVVFRSQTLATVAESARIKYKVGPTIAWYQDWLRYYFLTVESQRRRVDGAAIRGAGAAAVPVRNAGGAAAARRGARAGQRPGMAVDRHHRGRPAAVDVHADEVGRAVRCVRRTGRRAGCGHRVRLRPDRPAQPPQPDAVRHRAAVRAGVGHLGCQRLVLRRQLRGAVVRHPARHRQPPGDVDVPDAVDRAPACWPPGSTSAWTTPGIPRVKDNRRNRVLASTPLLVVATIMVLGEVGSLAKGAVFRYPLYTTAKANLAAITSGLSPTSCAMADDVLAEPDPNAGLLQPVPGQTFGPDGPLGGINPVGFKPDGVGDDLRSYPVVTKPGVVNSDASPNKPNAAMSDSAGTAGGKGPVGVNGSHVALPFGLDPARTPVMGSYGENSLAATATSAWYQLPAAHPGPAAGGGLRRGRHLVVQRGRHLHLRAVAETAMGCRPPRRDHRSRSRRCSPSTSGRSRPGAICGSR